MYFFYIILQREKKPFLTQLVIKMQILLTQAIIMSTAHTTFSSVFLSSFSN